MGHGSAACPRSRSRREDVELVVRSGALRDLLASLEAHRLDVVLANFAPQRDSNTAWVSHPIAKQPVRLVGHAERIAGRDDRRERLEVEPLPARADREPQRLGSRALARSSLSLGRCEASCPGGAFPDGAFPDGAFPGGAFPGGAFPDERRRPRHSPRTRPGNSERAGRAIFRATPLGCINGRRCPTRRPEARADSRRGSRSGCRRAGC